MRFDNPQYYIIFQRCSYFYLQYCHDSNPDPSVFKVQGNVLVQGGYKLNLVSNVPLTQGCYIGCALCYERYFDARIVCIHPSRGKGSLCTRCKIALVGLGTNCLCPTGKYEFQNQVDGIYGCYGTEYTQCSTCSDLDFRYQQGSECLCKPKYIDNGKAQCMTCNYSCDTYEGTKYNCTSCPSGSLRTLNIQSSSCECPSGYYDAGITNCEKCDIICDSCSDQATTCLSCVIGSNRVYNQLTYYCDCLSGYYDAGDGTCSICHLTCSQCTGPLDTDCSSQSNKQSLSNLLIYMFYLLRQQQHMHLMSQHPEKVPLLPQLIK